MARRKLSEQEDKEARAAHLSSIAPELKEIAGQLAKAQADLRLAETEMKLLKKQYDREAAAINAAYERDRERAVGLGAVGRLREREDLLRNATVTRDSAFNSLRQQFEPRAASVKLRIYSLRETESQLENRRRNLLSKPQPQKPG